MTIRQLYDLYLKSSGISTDSRKVKSGNIFFSLKGPNFNGNQYAEAAIEKRAGYAVIDDSGFRKDERYILVDDVLQCLQKLANHHRKQFDISVIAIAGSNGKTTTKELIREVLSTSFETFATPGNYNNEIGVPLTLLGFKKDLQIAIVEMGAKNLGDIEELCRIAEPTHGIVTNTGKDHLETFKTLENTRKANTELYRYLAAKMGTVFVNVEDQLLMAEAKCVEDIATYGYAKRADNQGSFKEGFPFLIMNLQSDGTEMSINTKLAGKYNFENIMASIAVGRHFNVPDSLIKRAIEGYVPINNRSQIISHNSNTIILDAYNANPSSMKEAIDNLAAVQSKHKVAILGDMLELGDASYEEHLLLVVYLKSLGLSKIVLVGSEFKKVKDKIDCLYFDEVEEAKEWFQNEKFSETTLLLKGSRGIALEKLLTR